jgi:hypothetical protein
MSHIPKKTPWRILDVKFTCGRSGCGCGCSGGCGSSCGGTSIEIALAVSGNDEENIVSFYSAVLVGWEINSLLKGKNMLNRFL